MTGSVPSKDDALEALDFIISVLREHEKDLDRLISELGKIAEKLGEGGVLSERIGNIEERLANLQNEVANLISYLTSSQGHKAVSQYSKVTETKGPPIMLRCKHWEDFQALARQAQTISFLYKETEKIFQADALKGNQIITYSGELPKPTQLLKTWLSKQLEVPEGNILEGTLSIG